MASDRFIKAPINNKNAKFSAGKPAEESEETQSEDTEKTE